MLNTLGYCQIAKRMGEGGQLMTCQAPLCIRAGRIECEEGHPQPEHPEQKKIDAAQTVPKKPPPAAPAPAAYTGPEGTWLTLARVQGAQGERIKALEEQVRQLQKRLAGTEGAGKGRKGE